MFRSKAALAMVLVLAGALTTLGCTAPNSPSSTQPGVQSVPQPGVSRETDQQPRQLRKIRVANGSIAGSGLPIWVALEAGLFEKYGLEAEVTYIPSGVRALQALIAGEAEFVFAGANQTVAAKLGGADVVMVASATSTMTFDVVSAPDIISGEHVRGKNIGITRRQSSSDLAARYALRHWGLDPDKDVTLVEVGGQPEMFAALESGAIQVAMAGSSKYPARKAGFRTLARLVDLGLRYNEAAIIVSGSYLSSNQDVVRDFLKAFIETISDIKTDRQRTDQVLLKVSKVEDPEMRAEMWRDMATTPHFLDEVPYLRRDSMLTVLAELAMSNPQARDADPDQFVDNRLVAELEQSGFIKALYKR